MKKKLQENKGITIVLALGIFLVATILSAVIVSVSLNNAQRIQRQRDEQQANLAISSAAGFVIELLDGAKAVYSTEGGVTKWKFYYDDCLMKNYANLQTDFEACFGSDADIIGSFVWEITASGDTTVNEAIATDISGSIDGNGDIKIKISKKDNSKYFQIVNLKASTFSDGLDYTECTWHYLSIDRNGKSVTNGAGN